MRYLAFCEHYYKPNEVIPLTDRCGQPLYFGNVIQTAGQVWSKNSKYTGYTSRIEMYRAILLDFTPSGNLRYYDINNNKHGWYNNFYSHKIEKLTIDRLSNREKHSINNYFKKFYGNSGN